MALPPFLSHDDVARYQRANAIHLISGMVTVRNVSDDSIVKFINNQSAETLRQMAMVLHLSIPAPSLILSEIQYIRSLI